MTYGDTIAAISTPIGEGAIAVVRLTGAAALSILNRIFRSSVAPENFEPRHVYFGQIHDGAAKVDEVLATFFRGPASYTGEDVVEISCHGGILVTRRLLDLLLSAGARMANPGEFTQRAFLNGKLDRADIPEPSLNEKLCVRFGFCGEEHDSIVLETATNGRATRVF